MEALTKKIGNKGELVIPKKIRKQFGLKPDSKVEIFSLKDRIILVPIKRNFKELAGIFGKHKKIKDLDIITEEYLGGMI